MQLQVAEILESADITFFLKATTSKPTADVRHSTDSIAVCRKLPNFAEMTAL